MRCCSVACACRTELLELLILWWERATDGAREGAWLAILWWEGVGEEGGDMLSSMGVAGLDPPPILGLEGLLTPGNWDQKLKVYVKEVLTWKSVSKGSFNLDKCT